MKALFFPLLVVVLLVAGLLSLLGGFVDKTDQWFKAR